MKIIYTIVVIAIIALVGVAIGYNLNQQPAQPALSGIGGSPYNSTTTPSTGLNVDLLLHSGYGTFGSVIITGAGTQAFQLLNATTTNVDLRTGNVATSSIILANIPASLGAGVYTFDTVFTDGLYLDYSVGTNGTSTITWK